MTGSKTYNLNEQLESVTNIPKETLDEFDVVINEILSYNIYDANLDGKSSAIVDLGFGKLKMTVEGNAVKYFFIPSKLLDQYVRYAMTCKFTPLVHRIEKRVTDAMQEYYKELL